MSETYETPWGTRTVTETDKAVSRLVIAMLDDHDSLISEISYYNHEAIKKYSGGGVTIIDVVEMFTDNQVVINSSMVKDVKKLLTQAKKELTALKKEEEEIKDRCNKMRGVTRQEKDDSLSFLLAFKVEPKKEIVTERIKKNKQILSLVGQSGDGKDNKTLDFQRAKLFPITELLTFDHSGFSPCVWHSEKTGSMKYYKKDNHVHCFGCGRGGDAIDVVQAIKNCDIKEAVQFLTS